jgi:hypothetical protein
LKKVQQYDIIILLFCKSNIVKGSVTMTDQQAKDRIKQMILQRQGAFSVADISNMVRKQLGEDFVLKSYEVLDEMWKSTLLSYVGRDNQNHSTYKVSQ